MTSIDMEYLRNAKNLLENPGLTARIAAAVGTPVEKGLKILPQKVQSTIHKASEKSIRTSLGVALRTVNVDDQGRSSNNLFHKAVVAGTGGLGGFFGVTALLLELPVSTTLMMRSILDIARSEGENLETSEAQLACLEVFAFGGKSLTDDAAGSGYFMTRAALAKAFADAASVLAGRGLASEGSSVITRFVASIAARFQVVVGEKFAAQMVPVVGAFGGAAMNVLFMNHFQDMARGHFVVRRLERKYGAQAVRNAYESL